MKPNPSFLQFFSLFNLYFSHNNYFFSLWKKHLRSKYHANIMIFHAYLCGSKAQYFLGKCRIFKLYLFIYFPGVHLQYQSCNLGGQTIFKLIWQIQKEGNHIWNHISIFISIYLSIYLSIEKCAPYTDKYYSHRVIR